MDLNDDGKRDILSGSYSRSGKSMAGLFQVLEGTAEGKFSKPEAVKGTDGKPLVIQADKDNIVRVICTRPYAIDWDGDGDLDVLSGSSDGGVQWSENKAGKGKAPELKGFKTLIEVPDADGSEAGIELTPPTAPTRSTRVWADDINGDGKLDLLVGDSATLRKAADGLSNEECKKKEAEWQAKMEALNKEMAEVSPDGGDSRRKLSRKLGDHYQAREKFIEETRTGFVWLYLQK